MATTFKIKQGDLLPAIEGTCVDGDGNPVDLSVISGVRFHLKSRAAADTDDPLVDQPATVVNGPTGLVRYNWQAGDTDTPGLYRAEFEVTSAGKTTTFPNDGDTLVHIHRAVG